MKAEDAEASENDWDEVLKNERINRMSLFGRMVLSTTNDGLGKVMSSHLLHIMEAMVKKNVAVYEPPRQTRSVMLYWRSPEEWSEILHNWVCWPLCIYLISSCLF